MTPRVIAERMSRAYHAVQQIRVTRRRFADDKKGRAHVFFFEHVKNRLGVAAVRPVIERQRDDAVSGRNAGERRTEEVTARILHRFVREKSGGSGDARNSRGNG